MREKKGSLSFGVRITSLNMILSNSINLPSNFMISPFLTAEYYFILNMYHILIIHSCVKGHLSYFHSLDSANETAMNKAEQVSLK